MAQNFLACDRDQELLLPPSLREWLPEGHLAWFVIDAVAALDLRPFYAAYRDNGQGRSAHDPAMMVARSTPARSSPFPTAGEGNLPAPPASGFVHGDHVAYRPARCLRRLNEQSSPCHGSVRRGSLAPPNS